MCTKLFAKLFSTVKNQGQPIHQITKISWDCLFKKGHFVSVNDKPPYRLECIRTWISAKSCLLDMTVQPDCLAILLVRTTACKKHKMNFLREKYLSILVTVLYVYFATQR